MPGYSLFRIEVIGAATQYVVMDAAGEKIPWRAGADRPAEILKTRQAGHIDELVRKQLVVAVLPINTSPSLPPVSMSLPPRAVSRSRNAPPFI